MGDPFEQVSFPGLNKAEESISPQSPEEAYAIATTNEERTKEALDSVRSEIVDLQDKEEALRNRLSFFEERRTEAADQLAEYWKEALLGRTVIFSGEATRIRNESGKWDDLSTPKVFHSVCGTCISIFGRNEVIELNSRSQKLVERIKEPAVWIRVEGDNYLMSLAQYIHEDVVDEPELLTRLQDIASLQGSGLIAKRDIHIDPKVVQPMLEQWSDEREMPKTFVIHQGTILRIDSVIESDESDQAVIEFETYETDTNMQGVRPQNANARMRVSAIIDSIHDWDIIDDLEFVVQ